MCAIVGSYSTSKLLELVELNSYRGQHSYSFSLIDRNTGSLTILEKKLGTFNKSIAIIPGNCYGIAHIQAPTTSSIDENSIHPYAVLDKGKTPRQAIWHNGILKHSTVELLKGDSGITWDTQLLLMELTRHGWSALNNIDGTFSCLYYNQHRLFHFRNKISPMFFDEEMNLSSTKFDGSIETPAEAVLRFDLRYNDLMEVSKFKTVNNPYFFEDDL